MGSVARVTSAAEGLPRRRFTVAEVEAEGVDARSGAEIANRPVHGEFRGDLIEVVVQYTERHIDLVTANGENLAGGMGLTASTAAAARRLLSSTAKSGAASATGTTRKRVNQML